MRSIIMRRLLTRMRKITQYWFSCAECKILRRMIVVDVREDAQRFLGKEVSASSDLPHINHVTSKKTMSWVPQLLQSIPL